MEQPKQDSQLGTAEESHYPEQPQADSQAPRHSIYHSIMIPIMSLSVRELYHVRQHKVTSKGRARARAVARVVG
jgi:hypothetical protein